MFRLHGEYHFHFHLTDRAASRPKFEGDRVLELAMRNDRIAAGGVGLGGGTRYSVLRMYSGGRLLQAVL